MRKLGWFCLALAGILLAVLIAHWGGQSSVKTVAVMQQQPTDNPAAISSSAPATQFPENPPTPPTKAELRAQAAAAAKEKRLEAADQENARKAYAINLEKNLLDQDMDADVDVVGPQHTTLRLTWVLATKLFVYKLIQSDQMREDFQDMRALGFKKFVVRDGYDRSWTWNL